jgi:hypothetical protein
MLNCASVEDVGDLVGSAMIGLLRTTPAGSPAIGASSTSHM